MNSNNSYYGNEEIGSTEETWHDFEVPRKYVGLVIGIDGKTIKNFTRKANVIINIIDHSNVKRNYEYQICRLEGRKKNIQHCLTLLREYLPTQKYQEITLKRLPFIFVPTCPSSAMKQTNLPKNGIFNIYISSFVDTGHFFVQLPSSKSIHELEQLKIIMYNLYNCSHDPADCDIQPPDNYVDMLCAAPLNNEWYRAVTLEKNENGKMLVKFIDYGGFAEIPHGELRYMLRRDIMELPCQAVECYLSDVLPRNEKNNWHSQADELFQKICTQCIIQAEFISINRANKIPYLRLFLKNNSNQLIRFDSCLLKEKMAKTWDPSCCIQIPKKPSMKLFENSNNS